MRSASERPGGARPPPERRRPLSPWEAPRGGLVRQAGARRPGDHRRRPAYTRQGRGRGSKMAAAARSGPQVRKLLGVIDEALTELAGDGLPAREKPG